jgi:AAA15 family ATPase/GTPase
MLLQFNFKNYKSFRDGATLDMSATKITEFSDRVISIGNEKVLPVAAIFGANASGKSNVQEAFRFMATYVVQSFAFGGESTDVRGKRRFLNSTPFLFDADSSNAESTFEVYFIDSEEHGAKTYNYGFVIDKNGVAEEWLNYASKSSRGKFRTIFYRDVKSNELDLSGLPEKNRENIEVALERETLVVSLGAKLKISRLKFIRDWFVNLNFADYGEPFENLIMSRLIPDGFDSDKNVRKNVVKYLSAFDDSIVDFIVEKAPDDKDDEDEHFKIEAVHKMVNSNKTVSIPLNEESAGTLKMFSLYPVFFETLTVGSVLFIDELNARLHPLLVRSFIIAFLDPEINVNHAQLVFTSHDSWQLNSNLLRRDEIWFTEKDHDGISTLYSLADFLDDDGLKIRKDENYEKNYLLGKYGAIPSLKSLDIFREE